MINRRCELVECGKAFVTNDKRKLFCCNAHAKRHCERQRRGVTAGFGECSLPECGVDVLFVGRRRKFCSKDHADLDGRRWKNSRGKSFYRRLLGVGNPCAVCGEKLIVDEHHIEFRGSKSNKKSKTIWLCPTHHMAIHRGFAKIVDGKFVWLIEMILDGLRRKQGEVLMERGLAASDSVPSGTQVAHVV